ncbi:HD domain-containing protein [Clostridium estertheticum]|uniref:HD domain-containing protein n=1 Tax=Clostridium estertheticum TaxID=238834 RepID=UPI00209B71EF|nr:HD domain-containing protein [Clostridium estertheticum]WAG63426.1 HD domain-containing protein [Clostridium estertheticum]
MNRIEILRKYIDEILLNMTDVEERRCAYLHLYGVAQSCALIALKRGENAELATMAGMLHDIYSYAKMICDAIYTHSLWSSILCVK